MLDPTQVPYVQSLGDGLVLRTATDEADVLRVAEFNGIIHGPGVNAMTRLLFLNHPDTRGRDLIFVQDESSKQVISSLCVIPWTWSIGGVPVPSGEMGIVGTLEAYRRRGLVRAQVGFFKRRLQERGCLLSHIQGIPYYYRQFGYEYALPLEGGLLVEHREIPAYGAAYDGPPFSFRLASAADLPLLARLFDEAARDLDIHIVRSEPVWQYLLTQIGGSETDAETWLVVDAAGSVAGYFCLPAHHFGHELAVSEVSRLSFDAALATLNQLRSFSEARGTPGIRLNLPANCTLLRLAHSCVNRDHNTYNWQIHIPDMAALLRALGPALEQRIAASPFAGLTCDVPLGFYRETIRLCFVEGRLREVVNAGFVDGGPVRFPPNAFVPLVLGYRSLEETRRAYPDVGCAPALRLLVETLFPRQTSFIYTIY
jgi:hypothetical protein